MTENSHAPGSEAKPYVLLVNLGSPAAPEKGAVKKYLKKFLSDPRVIKNSGLLWKMLLNAFILPLRSGKVAEKYRQIWLPEGAPLAVYTEKLTHKLAGRHPDKIIDHAMVYAEPSIQQRLQTRNWQPSDELLVLALYPQYSRTTFDPIRDQVTAFFSRLPVQQRPRIQYVQDYSTHPFYIRALADAVRQHWQEQGRGKKLLMSFHGLPQEYIDAGDPYATHCQATAEKLAQALNLQSDDWQLAWQSQFGPRQWLEPKTDVVLTAWAKQGIDCVDVVCPGFATDGLETLEEINLQYRAVFEQAGGRQLAYIPALNDSLSQVLLMEQLMAEKLPARQPR